ncbi:MAG: hypothetical protein PHT33_13975 [bacterium]|nr:hypothetical protein [bacterium]
MIRWLFFPAKKTPPVVGHDLLLMGATEPVACNGYYDYVGMSGELKYYKHVTENYYVCSPSVYISTQSSWWVTNAPPGEYEGPLFNLDITTGSGAPPIGAYTGFIGAGTVVVYPVNVSLSGATNPATCNGDYVQTGMDEGRPYYKHVSADYYIQYDSGFWVVSAEAPPISTMNYFFKDGGDTPVGAYDIDQGSGNVTVSAL